MNIRRVVQHVDRRINEFANFVHDEDARHNILHGEFNSQARRLALAVVAFTPGLPDFIYQQRIIRPYAKIGREVIGCGAHAITLSDGPSSVQKILQKTRGMSESDQQIYIASLESKQNVTLRHLEDFTPVQEFSIDSDPLEPSKPVVVSRQKRINGTDAIHDFRSSSPQSRHVNAFIVSSKTMLEDSNALPDLAGNANVLMNEQGLHLVDTICLQDGNEVEAYAFTTSLVTLQPHFDKLEDGKKE